MSRLRVGGVVVVGLLFSFHSAGAEAGGTASQEILQAHQAFLADDLLQGRDAGSPGHEIAARYIASQFQALGLEPAGDGGSYL